MRFCSSKKAYTKLSQVEKEFLEDYGRRCNNLSKVIPSVKPYFPDEDIEQIKNDVDRILRSGMLTRGARDEATGHFVALKETFYGGKKKLIMVAYDVKDGVVELVTIHPIKNSQVEARIKSGRWVRVR